MDPKTRTRSRLVTGKEDFGINAEKLQELQGAFEADSADDKEVAEVVQFQAQLKVDLEKSIKDIHARAEATRVLGAEKAAQVERMSAKLEALHDKHVEAAAKKRKTTATDDAEMSAATPVAAGASDEAAAARAAAAKEAAAVAAAKEKANTDARLAQLRAKYLDHFEQIAREAREAKAKPNISFEDTSAEAGPTGEDAVWQDASKLGGRKAPKAPRSALAGGALSSSGSAGGGTSA